MIDLQDPSQQKRVASIFFPHAKEKGQEVKDKNIKFAHYTSAFAALQIIQNEEFWLRNAAVMNDFSEIQHGQKCLVAAWHDKKLQSRLFPILNSIETGLVERLTKNFDSQQLDRAMQSYLLSVSEHGNKASNEEQYGRLSMWRAYGGDTNVALILNNSFLESNTKVLNAYSSPVRYQNTEDFKKDFERVIDGLESNQAFLKQIGPGHVLNYLTSAFHNAVLSTKHPGFVEEKEWRVIHSPTMAPSDMIKFDLETIAGVPQRIYKLRLENHPANDLTGITLPELLEEIIIGPVANPLPIYDALTTALHAIGVENAPSKVKMSNIPLRR